MRSLIISICLLLAISAAHAHHSRAMFQLDKTVTFEGTVSDFKWRTPHIYLELETTSDSGEVQVWTFEGHSIAGLLRNGWEKESVAMGDQVVIVANPNSNPEKMFGLLDNVTVTGGETFYSFRVPRNVARNQSTVSAPVTGSTDFSGTWRSTRIQGNALNAPADTGVRRALTAGFAPPSDWPLTDLAQAQVEKFDLNNDPWLDCEPLSVPRVILSPFSHQWTRTSNSIVIQKELSPMIRTIHLDGSSPPDDYVPSAAGYSVGHIEDDGTLVIETTAFSATRWGSERGVDSSTQKHIIETFKLSDNGERMTVSYTLTDPPYLREPVTINGAYQKIADHELATTECDLETTRRHLEFE